MPRTKTDRRGQARALYGRGATLAQVAAAIGVSDSTLSRWRAEDKRAGRDWEAERKRHGAADLRDVISHLINQIRKLVEQAGEKATPGYADSLQKLTNVLNKLIDLYGDSLQQLMDLDRYAQWYEGEAEGIELDALRRWTNAYMAHLKEISG